MMRLYIESDSMEMKTFLREEKITGAIILQPVLTSVKIENMTDRSVKMWYRLSCGSTQKVDIDLGLNEFCGCETLEEDYFLPNIVKEWSVWLDKTEDDLCLTLIHEEFRGETRLRISEKKQPLTLRQLCILTIQEPIPILPNIVNRDLETNKGIMEVTFEASGEFVRNGRYFKQGKNTMTWCKTLNMTEYVEDTYNGHITINRQKESNLYWEKNKKEEEKKQNSQSLASILEEPMDYMLGDPEDELLMDLLGDPVDDLMEERLNELLNAIPDEQLPELPNELLYELLDVPMDYEQHVSLLGHNSDTMD